jgi:hypothetical protein
MLADTNWELIVAFIILLLTAALLWVALIWAGR